MAAIRAEVRTCRLAVYPAVTYPPLNQRPFELKTINIRDTEHKKWWRKYCYDIPVLHLEDKLVAKGRWDRADVLLALNSWKLPPSSGDHVEEERKS